MLHYGILVLVSLLLLVGLFVVLKRYRKIVLIAILLYIGTFIGVITLVMSGHEYSVAEKSYDYVLVFGGGLKDGYDLPDLVVNRLEQGLAATRNIGGKFIVSGGYGQGERPSEASVMAEYLMARGVDEKDIILEEASMSTWDNLVYTKELLSLPSMHKGRVLGVSSEFHLFRIGLLKNRLPFEMDLLPAKTPFLEGLDVIPREYFALVKSLIFDWPDHNLTRLVLDEADVQVHALTPIVMDLGRQRPDTHHVAEVSVATVGDIMVHRSQLIRAFDGDAFDFAPSFEWVAPLIKDVDYAIGNLETTLAGQGGQRRLNVEQFYQGYSGYPVFNAPDILAKNLKDAGFDLMLTANNHTLDSKESGVLRTIDVLEAQEFDQIGSYKSSEEAEALFIKEIDGITFGIINYTYAMNGFWLKGEEDYMINHLGNYDSVRIETMYDEVAAMAEEEVDFVVVALHYGIEYVQEPDSHIQQPLVDGLFDHGADIILGGHPHVLQPFEVRVNHRSNGEDETGVVIYSLGNFISSQRYRYTNKDTDFGMIFQLDFKKIDEEKATIESLSYAPTYVHWSDEDLIILPIYQLPADIELRSEDRSRIAYAKEKVIPLINSYYEGDYTMDGPYLKFDLN